MIMIGIKKILAAVLVAATALSLAACTNPNARAQKEPEASAISKPLISASPKAADKPTATPKAKATATPKSTPKATAKPTQAPTATPTATQAPTATPVPTEAPTATPVPTQAPEQSENNAENNNLNLNNSEQTTENGFTEQDARNLLAMPCYVLSGFDDKSYNVIYDENTVYYGYWESQEDLAFYGPNGLVTDEGLTDDMITGAACYFKVTSASSEEEVKNQLLAYVSYDVLDELYSEPLFDYQGETYIRRGGMGYYRVDRLFESATITDLTDTSFSATMDCYEFGQYMGTCTINLEKSGDNWFITGYFENF